MPRLEASLSQLRAWDRSLCVRFNHGARIVGLGTFFRGVSRLGDGVLWYALMLAMLAGGVQGLHTVLRMAATGFVCTLVYKWLKSKTSRPRPYEVDSAVRAGAAPLDAFSFPSGHTLHAVAFTMVAVASYSWLAWLLVPFCLLIATSRLVLGLHYPSDVLAGAGLGALIAQTALCLQ
jgi:undecaprenyl-diphosphatase